VITNLENIFYSVHANSLTYSVHKEDSCQVVLDKVQ